MPVVRWYGKHTEFFGSTFVEWLAWGLAVFLVLFPKGGLKVGPIPLTWGYGLLGVTLILGLPFWILGNSARVSRGSLAVFSCLVPLQLLFIYSVLVNGIDDFGFALSDFVAFFVLPVAFLIIFPKFLGKIRMEHLLRMIRWLIFLAAAYGIFLFWWRLATGKYIEIPFLTVNADDLGTLDTKYNSRPDGLFKLISTYNNGNQYGVATLLFLPLFDMCEHSRLRKLIVRVALMLTLSRTVWIGLILNEAIDIFRYVRHDLVSSQRLSVRCSTFFRVGRLALLSAVVLGMTFLFSGVSFLFDSSLGGRTEYFDHLGQLTLLPSQPVAQFAEIIYLSALTMLGWAGLATILLLFCSPLLISIFFSELRRTAIQAAALQGLVLYIALAAMDGALNYIPTMAFYWFLWMLLIHCGEDYATGARDKNALRVNLPRTLLSAGGQ